MYTFATGRDVATGLFRLFLEQAPDAIIFADRQGLVRVWNRRASEVFGHAANEILGESLDLIIPEGLCEGALKDLRGSTLLHHAETGTCLLTVPALRKDGEKRHVELALSVVLDDLARVVGCMAVARDISQRYLAELAVLRAETALHGNRTRTTNGHIPR